jgi:hypothetical protein
MKKISIYRKRRASRGRSTLDMLAYFLVTFLALVLLAVIVGWTWFSVFLFGGHSCL